jgi:uncharacterized protein YggU (UPF0235/DUF167 family)
MHIKIRAKTGQKKESFVQKNEDTFLVSVKEEAERNMANKRIIALVAKHFNLPAAKVRIIKGQTSSSKIMLVS